MDKEKAKEKIKRLISKYENLSVEQKKNYNEQQTKDHFIRPLFEALGWDFENDVWPETDVSGKRVDYAFKLEGLTRLYVEAKPLSINLDEEKWAEQAINYSYHQSVPWVILIDFEGIKVFNTEWDEPNIQSCQFIELHYTEFLENEKLWWLSKEGFLKGLLDKKAEEFGRKPKKIPVDEQLANDLVRWRDYLYHKLEIYNSGTINKIKIAEYVQTILNRFIFIRTLEDKGYEDHLLDPLVKNWDKSKHQKIVLALNKIFRKIGKDYDSGLFDEISWDKFGEKLEYDDEIFIDVIKELYYNSNKVRYKFDQIPSDIFGSIYEQYLGHIQQEGKEKKSSKRKAQGIYYTPRYIVNYIVQNTLGEVLKEKSAEEIRNLKILDPACGSGSFLINAYQTLFDYWLKVENKKLVKSEKTERLLKQRKGSIISSQEKMRILINNIFGVDLDEEAVEIAKLNLLLKIVRKKMKLPNIDRNIQNGNSLISGGEGELKKYFSKNWGDKRPFNWQDKFIFCHSHENGNPGFDVIIGNPPYVRVDSLVAGDKQYWKKIYEVSKGKYDLYYLFIEKSINLLKNGGKLGFIIPNKFCVASSAKMLREIIFRNSISCEFISVSQLDVFKEASNYPIILILTKGDKLNNIEIKSCKTEEDFNKKDFDRFILTKKDLKILPAGIIPININKQQLDLAIKLLKNSAKLKNCLKISEGLRIPVNLEKNNEKFGIVKQYQFSRYSIIKKGSFISEKDLNKIVSAKSERFINSMKKKILIAEDALCITATMDNGKNIPQGGVYFGVTIKDDISLKSLIAIINSKLLSFVYKALFGGMHMGGGYLRYRTEFLNELPFVETSSDNQKDFSNYFDKMTEKNEELQKLDPIMDDKEYNELKQEIEKTDKEIDKKVYELYGLTEEEIKIVENN